LSSSSSGSSTSSSGQTSSSSSPAGSLSTPSLPAAPSLPPVGSVPQLGLPAPPSTDGVHLTGLAQSTNSTVNSTLGTITQQLGTG
jgi:hypothetical protein